jgi:hypothetical protein
MSETMSGLETEHGVNPKTGMSHAEMRWRGRGRNQFFFEKKNKKNFATLSPRQPSKSLLLLFFRNEDLNLPAPAVARG